VLIVTIADVMMPGRRDAGGAAGGRRVSSADRPSPSRSRMSGRRIDVNLLS